MINSHILTVAASSAPWWSLSSLWSSLRALQWAAAISALILTIGAITEYWEKLKQLTFLTGKWLLGRSKPFERCVLRKFLVHSLGPILVTVGIAGDFIFEGRAFILEDRQEAQAEKNLVSLEDRATALKGQFDVVKQEADSIGNQEDTIDKRVASASTKLGAVEADVLAQGPRWRLLERGQDTFVKALKAFPGQRITIVRCGNEDREQFDFDSALAQLWPKVGWTPSSAQWDQCPLIGWNEIHFVTSSGNVAERWAGIPPGQWLKTVCWPKGKTAGDALCKVLNGLKIYTIGNEERATPRASVNAKKFFGEGSPAEMALKEPETIFLLIGHDVPMFDRRITHPNKKGRVK